MVSQEIVWLKLEDLVQAPWNINEMSDEAFIALMDDMNRKDGPFRIQPVRVRPIKGGKYQIIDGHQRVEAARRLGWTEIRAIITECSEIEARILNFRINYERGQISPIREAEFYKFLLERGWSLHRIERELGIRRQRVQQILRRLNVTQKAAKILETPLGPELIVERARLSSWKGVTPSHYEVIGRLKEPKLQEEAAKITVEHGLSAKETHTLVDHIKKGVKPSVAVQLILRKEKQTEAPPAEVFPEPSIQKSITSEKPYLKPETATLREEVAKTGTQIFECEECGAKYMVDWEKQRIIRKLKLLKFRRR
jgi:ParB/RepB/Spo0J family partition protein